MRPNRLVFLLLLTLAACSSAQPLRQSSVDVRGAGTDETEQFINDLIGRMTLDEKLGQLTQYPWGFATGPLTGASGAAQTVQRRLVREGRIGSFLNVFGADSTRALQRIAVEESRLKIPLLFGFDVIHGYRTIFPVPLAEAATFTPEAAERSARIAAIEASAVGLHWTFAPMVDIARDARWGRVVEGAGEDPYLGTVMAEARVRGFQGDDLSLPHTIAACAKHYAAYGGAEAGRDYNTVDMSEHTLRSVYLPPFLAAKQAGVATFMSAFNEIGGVPASGSPFLLDEVLRQEWRFDGFVVSDWNSIGELMNHRVAASRSEAGIQALLAGVDMDMVSGIYSELADEVRAGRIPESVVDESVRRILRIKQRLGLFDDPYRYSDAHRERDRILAREHIEAAREVARESIVLLKNEGNLLPLSKDVSTIAVIGPLASDSAAPLGPWAGQGRAEDVISVLEGIRQAVSSRTRILHSAGSRVSDRDTTGFAEAVAIAREADVVVLVLGESPEMSGEAGSRASLELPGVQLELARAIQRVGKPTVAVLMNGRPLALSWLAENVPAILETWFLGIQAGPATADVLFGDYNPSGRLPVTFPRATGQVPIYYNHKSTGRPPEENNRYSSKYVDLPWTPLFSFGHGLSYTQFEYTDLRIPRQRVQAGDSITVQVSVRNTGSSAGREVVQLYARDQVASVTPPVIELKGFTRLSLAPGEQRTVTFSVPAALLGVVGADLQTRLEPGAVDILVGASSSDIRLRGSVDVVGPATSIDASRVSYTRVSVH